MTTAPITYTGDRTLPLIHAQVSRRCINLGRSLVLDERMTADLWSSAELADAGECVAPLRSPVVVSAGGDEGRAGLLAGR